MDGPFALNGALSGTRTHGLSLRRAALYPLSYQRVMWCRRWDLNPHELMLTTP